MTVNYWLDSIYGDNVKGDCVIVGVEGNLRDFSKQFISRRVTLTLEGIYGRGGYNRSGEPVQFFSESYNIWTWLLGNMPPVMWTTSASVASSWIKIIRITYQVSPMCQCEDTVQLMRVTVCAHGTRCSSRPTELLVLYLNNNNNSRRKIIKQVDFLTQT